jgi:FKBP-type peptidyl-prolyl cis-trans isomerase SlyD
MSEDAESEAGQPVDESNEAVEETEEAAGADGVESEPESLDAHVDETTDEAEAEDETDGLAEGDFVEFDYTARTVEDGDLVDTTEPEVAEEADVDTDDQEFSPRTIVLGQGHIFGAVEDEIIGAEIGDTGNVTVPASEAFGEYDEEEVRTVSKDKIPEEDRYPGAQVTIDGQQGFVETIIGGRARVDFNHPLAGEDVEYEYEILDEVTDRQAKAGGLLGMMLDLDLDVRFETDTVEEERLVEPDEADDDEVPEPEYETVEVEKESLYIDATPQLSMNQQWMIQKQQIAQQLMDLLGVDRVVVQEVIEGPGGMGMPGMMGGMGGGGELEEVLEEADIDADELAEELE